MKTLPPLAERMRPKHLDELIGQEHLKGEKGILTLMLKSETTPSIILWGPPGCGKTSIATVLNKQLEKRIINISAINAGIKEVKQVINEAKMFKDCPILFIDEIHRFNKSQQDALLGAVENGIISLLGATTENPSFEVNTALLSRCLIFTLKPLQKEHISTMINNALSNDTLLSQHNITMEDIGIFYHYSGGDARKAYNLLDLSVSYATKNSKQNKNKQYVITNESIKKIALQKTVSYDKKGEQHYDIISALIKSIRGSDPHAATYWLARMIEGGEDVKFIARRLLILASEDIGLANPAALSLANSCFQAVNVIGYPEARIILSQCAVYLACSEKSNSTYLAIDQAIRCVKKTADLPVPLHLRNAPTKMMKDMNYGKEYLYPHNFPEHYTAQEYLPQEIKNEKFYIPAENKREDIIKKNLEAKGLL